MANADANRSKPPEQKRKLLAPRIRKVPINPPTLGRSPNSVMDIDWPARRFQFGSDFPEVAKEFRRVILGVLGLLIAFAVKKLLGY